MAAEPFELVPNEADLLRFRKVMGDLAAAGHDLSPAMRLAATELGSQTEANFAAEGRPAWPDLAASTIAARKKKGHWPGQKEQVSGGLAASTSTSFGPTFAQVGQSKVYAAIQNLGGVAKHKERTTTLYFKTHKGEVSRHFVHKSKSNFAQTATIGAHETTLPPRPSLPITPDGGLQAEAEEAVMDEVLDYFRMVVGG